MHDAIMPLCRTTVDLEAELLSTLKELAQRRGVTLGQIISELTRKSLPADRSPRVRNGVRLFDSKPSKTRPDLHLCKHTPGLNVSIGLLDVNVLVALFDEMHVRHEDAHRWFGFNRKAWMVNLSDDDQRVRSRAQQPCLSDGNCNTVQSSAPPS